MRIFFGETSEPIVLARSSVFAEASSIFHALPGVPNSTNFWAYYTHSNLHCIVYHSSVGVLAGWKSRAHGNSSFPISKRSSASGS